MAVKSSRPLFKAKLIAIHFSVDNHEVIVLDLLTATFADQDGSAVYCYCVHGTTPSW